MNLRLATLSLTAASLGIAQAQNTYTYAGTNGASWIRASNWTGGAVNKSPGVDANTSTTVDGATTDIAAVSSSFTIVGIGINFNTGTNSGVTTNGGANQSLTLGAITFATGGTAGNMLVGNNSTSLGGVLTLSGVTVNSVSNVILRNSSANTLTLANIQGGGNKTMGVALGNTTDNQVVIDGSGGVTISSVVSGASKNLTLGGSGNGALTLSGINSYTGTTTINGATLAVNGSLDAGSAVTVNAGGTLGGTGTVNGIVTVKSNGIVGPGNSPGVLTTGAASFESGSIFSWELNNNLDGDTADAGDTGARGTNYDGLTSSSLAVANGAIFRVVLTDAASLTNAFWDANQSWTNIFSVAGTTTNAAFNQLFNSFEVFNGTTNVTSTYTSEGAFSFNNSTLTWTAVPEPSSALAGLLIAAGLLRRRRVA